MTTIVEFKSYGEELEQKLKLRTSPVAVKMLKEESEIPPEAVRPKRDRGHHLAQCQVFALTRRKGETIAMLKEDNWCWAPLIGYGLVEPFNEKTISPLYYIVENMDAARKMLKTFPRFEQGEYIGILTAPLQKASFKPDLVLIYSNPAQLRSMLLATKYKKGELVRSEFDPIDSCVYSIVPVIQSGQYRITLPDPGEYERAMTGEDEIIFSVPAAKMKELMDGLKFFEGIKLSYTDLSMQMTPDFPQPPFYQELFQKWGLDAPPQKD
ncbi:MAG: DUF169 domain-containing protein [Dehalococcoidia bacterium]|jgi:uncharacterized protein (DUF169 family)